MSRSRKDGRGSKGHQRHRHDDFWSRRLFGCPPRTSWWKMLTHRMERRDARAIEAEALAEVGE